MERLKTIGAIALTALITTLIFTMYIAVRICKAPLFWTSIDKFSDWHDFEDNPTKIRRFQRDTITLIVTLLLLFTYSFFGIWFVVAEILLLTGLLIYLMIKYLPPPNEGRG